MTATAAKPGYGTGSWYANHGAFAWRSPGMRMAITAMRP